MTKSIRQTLLFFALAATVSITACSDDSSTAPDAGRMVTDAMPLELGSRWEYVLEQSIHVPREDTTLPPFTGSSTGRQIVTITRTENIGGHESFGMKIDHVMDYIFSAGADTVVEVRYLAPAGDGRVLLKADEAVYNPTGGFIPLGDDEPPTRLGTMIEAGGERKFVSMEKLAYLLAGPRGTLLKDTAPQSPSLASDGVSNRENALLYQRDYIWVYEELYKGLNWVSLAAGGVGGIDISQRVTAVLDELDGFEGPIAEVSQTNTLIGSVASENYVQRYYYKGGVGIIRAEISDPEFLIWQQLPDGSTVLLGLGTWTFIKTLSDYELR